MDPTSGKEAKKKVFLVLSSGSISRLKIQKICESFNASVYPRPENLHAVNDRTNELRSMLDERQQVCVILRCGAVFFLGSLSQTELFCACSDFGSHPCQQGSSPRPDSSKGQSVAPVPGSPEGQPSPICFVSVSGRMSVSVLAYVCLYVHA